MQSSYSELLHLAIYIIDTCMGERDNKSPKHSIVKRNEDSQLYRIHAFNNSKDNNTVIHIIRKNIDTDNSTM